MGLVLRCSRVRGRLERFEASVVGGLDFGGGVVITVADGSDQGCRAEAKDPVGVQERDVVRSSVGVVDRPGDIAAGPRRHLHRR